jgi:hypothetical protein
MNLGPSYAKNKTSGLEDSHDKLIFDLENDH